MLLIPYQRKNGMRNIYLDFWARFQNQPNGLLKKNCAMGS